MIRVGTRDILLDEQLMTYLGGGALPLDRDKKQRVLHAANFVEMRNRRVWIHNPRTGTKREVPPMHEREEIIRQTLKALGFPHGHQLYEALKPRYFWMGMRKDCICISARSKPR